MTVESFVRVSINCPKTVLQVIQNIYGRFDNALYWVLKAANTTLVLEKVEYLEKAKPEVFFQFGSLELLVKAHALTVGQSNEVLMRLKEAYEQLSKWYNSCVKQISSERK